MSYQLLKRLLLIAFGVAVLQVSLQGKCLNKRFKLVDYGNDEAAIAQLVADVNANGGGRVVFPENAVIEVSLEDDFSCGYTALPKPASILFGFYGCKKVSVDLNGSTIALKSNHSTKYIIFLFRDCKKFTLKNGTIIGDSRTHDYSPVIYRDQEIKTSHQWGYGVQVAGSSGIISHMTVSNMTGDGVYVSSFKDGPMVTHTRVNVEDCDIGFCRRNGVTVASTKGCKIANTKIHHIGTHDGISGASPQAGIDFEYEDGVGDIGAIEVVNCKIYDCTEKTISASNTTPPTPSAFLISKSYFEGSEFQIAKVQSSKGKRVVGCHFKDVSFFCGNAFVERCEFDLGTSLSYVHGTCFKDCFFIGETESHGARYGCCLVGNTLSKASFVNCTFRSIRGRNDGSAFQGFSGYHFPLNADFHNCHFVDCSFVIGNPEKESELSFTDCSFEDGCLIQNRGERVISFTRSRLENVSSYSNQNGRFSFNKCELIQDDPKIEYPIIYYGRHQVRNSTIKNTLPISESMKRRGVSRALIQEIE